MGGASIFEFARPGTDGLAHGTRAGARPAGRGTLTAKGAEHALDELAFHLFGENLVSPGEDFPEGADMVQDWKISPMISPASETLINGIA